MELRRVLDVSFQTNSGKAGSSNCYPYTRSNNKAVKVSHLNDGTNTTYWATTDDATGYHHYANVQTTGYVQQAGVAGIYCTGSACESLPNVEVLEQGA